MKTVHISTDAVFVLAHGKYSAVAQRPVNSGAPQIHTVGGSDTPLTMEISGVLDFWAHQCPATLPRANFRWRYISDVVERTLSARLVG